MYNTGDSIYRQWIVLGAPWDWSNGSVLVCGSGCAVQFGSANRGKTRPVIENTL